MGKFETYFIFKTTNNPASEIQSAPFHSTSDFSFSILLSLFSLVAKTESNSGQEIVEAIKVGRNGGILGCDARYKTVCQTGP